VDKQFTGALTDSFQERIYPMEKIRFCLIGAGRAGLVHAKNVAWRIPQGEFTAVCDPDEKALNETADRFGVKARFTSHEEALASDAFDAVIIVTPTFLHRDIACAAAEAGKHIFLEKPMAITVEECEAINRAVADAGVKLQIGFMRRFDEGFMRAHELLVSGEMGRVMVIKSTGRGPGLPPPWIYDIDKCNGILAEVNSHDIDSIRWFTGSEIKRVYAEGMNFKCHDARDEFPDFYDNAVVSLRFDDDTLGMIDGTCPCHYGYDARVEILCEKGVVFIGSAQQHGLTHITIEGQVRGRAVKGWRNLFEEAYIAEMAHFIECVLNDTEPRVSGEDGLRAVEVVRAANASLKNLAPVELEGALSS
jgi:predicted dehydrogenase